MGGLIKYAYTPGVFTVEQHVRGKWACRQCETLIQAPVPAQVIDKGIPTAGLLAHVMVAKFADHLPLYLQEKIFARAGLAIARHWRSEAGKPACSFSRWSMPSANPTYPPNKRRAIEHDHQMENGETKIRARKPQLYYLNQRLNLNLNTGDPVDENQQIVMLRIEEHLPAAK